jgi:hypothetical protein
VAVALPVVNACAPFERCRNQWVIKKWRKAMKIVEKKKPVSLLIVKQ